MNNPKVLVSPADLARTYSSHAYSDAWDIVDDYQRVLEYTATRPNAGSQSVATALDLPRGRIRPWIDDGAIPHPVRGIQTAESHAWLPLDESTDAFDAINSVASWVCARGSIKPETYLVTVVVHSERDRATLNDLFATLGLETTIERDESDHRSAELRPRADGSVFSRVLLCLGLPLESERQHRLPPYLETVSRDARETFGATYLDARGSLWEFADRWMISHDGRPDGYLRSLATLYDDLGAEVDVHDHGVSIDTDFAEQLHSRID